MKPIRELIRLARQIHMAYEHGAAVQSRVPQVDWQRLKQTFVDIRRWRRLLAKAMSRGWRLAAQLQQQALLRALNYLRHVANEMHTRSMVEMTPVPSRCDLMGELQHLQDDFGAVIIDWSAKTLAVETDAIVLEDFNLGSFRLRLHWPRLAGADCFDVVARAPKRAGSDQNVTHPHVRHHKLCAPEATLPLQRTLEQGRLGDAFCLIRSVLETYNDSSAYVRLKDWEGVSCWSCSGELSSDDRSFVNAVSTTFAKIAC
jgi:hypothetical protein